MADCLRDTALCRSVRAGTHPTGYALTEAERARLRAIARQRGMAVACMLYRASRLVGIRVDRHRLLLFVYLGASVGLVALLATARLGSGSPTIGSQFEIDVLTAVILGGVAFNGGSGRPFGVFVGVVTIGILNSGMIFIGLDDFYQQIAKGVVLLAALAADQALGWAKQRHPRSQVVAASGDDAARRVIRRGNVALSRTQMILATPR